MPTWSSYSFHCYSTNYMFINSTAEIPTYLNSISLDPTFNYANLITFFITLKNTLCLFNLLNMFYDWNSFITVVNIVLKKVSFSSENICLECRIIIVCELLLVKCLHNLHELLFLHHNPFFVCLFDIIIIVSFYDTLLLL